QTAAAVLRRRAAADVIFATARTLTPLQALRGARDNRANVVGCPATGGGTSHVRAEHSPPPAAAVHRRRSLRAGGGGRARRNGDRLAGPPARARPPRPPGGGPRQV